MHTSWLSLPDGGQHQKKNTTEKNPTHTGEQIREAGSDQQVNWDGNEAVVHLHYHRHPSQM